MAGNSRDAPHILLDDLLVLSHVERLHDVVAH
jgi:hypothetical protein